ncbi:MAG: MaoC/PaaZ C-terminal domain-containing protein [Ignavibacteriaceae bacterium]|nr:MaoC/PaaZ C-terminal domain-containing protein [Ignavibacteriaceae bacterium]
MNKGDLYTCSFNVSPDIYEGFISVFKDKNPLHTNESFAVNKGFKEKVMHGNILNGFLSYFIGECLPVKDVLIQTQEIKFMKPVYLNDNLILHAEIEEVHESVNTIEFKYFFENRHQVKVARGTIQIGLLK